MRAVAFAAALALAGPVAAQAPAPRSAGTPPSEEQLQDALDTLSVFVTALNAANVSRETKAGLLLCLYANPLGQLARGQAAALAKNTAIDPKSPGQRLALIAQMCRVPLSKPAAAQPKK